MAERFRGSRLLCLLWMVELEVLDPDSDNLFLQLGERFVDIQMRG